MLQCTVEAEKLCTDLVFYKLTSFLTLNAASFKQDRLEIFSLLSLFYLFSAVPEFPPPNFVVDKRSSTSIRAKWDTFNGLSLWNGIGLGYEIQYRLKNTGSGSWISVLIGGTSNREYFTTGLLKYRTYEFKVAGRTIKGSGTFSDIKEERTMEDGM